MRSRQIECACIQENQGREPYELQSRKQLPGYLVLRKRVYSCFPAFLIQQIHHGLGERSEVARRAAGNKVAVDDDWFIDPDAAGVFEVVFDAARACDAFAFQDFSGNGNPAAVTNK